MGTFTDSVEAREYIERTIRDWNVDDDSEMIIKLADLTEKLATPKITAKMRKDVLEKNINALNSCITRNRKLDPDIDTKGFASLRDKVQVELDEIMKDYKPPVPRKRTK